MLCLKNSYCAWGIALAAALSSEIAAQTVDAGKQLMEAQQLRVQGRFAEARKVFSALLQDAKTEHLDTRFVAMVLDNLGIDEQNAGRFTEAERAFNRALSSLHASAPDDPVQIALKTDLAELYIAEERPDDAEPLLRQAAAVLRSSAQPDTVASSAVYNDLAVISILKRKFRESEVLLRRSQSLIETKFGLDHPMLTSGLLTFTALLTAEHRYADAVVPAERAWKILRTSSLFIPKPYSASALNVLSAIYFRVGRIDEAESCARQSILLAEEGLGPQHPRVGLYLANYAVILKHEDRKNQAKEIQKRADAILAQSQAAHAGGYTVSVDALR